MSRRDAAKFESEAAMCEIYIEIATGKRARPGGPAWISRRTPQPTGWISYPETDGWDFLLVRERDGFQIGFEAKLRLNDQVIMQAIEGRRAACAPGPDCRAVLVPYGTGTDLHRVFCQQVGIQIVTITENGYTSPDIPREDIEEWDTYADSWPQMLPAARCKLPDFIPDSRAGSASPITLTPWKIKAIKIACIMERRGWLCRLDFKHLDIDHRLFVTSKWIATVDGAYRRGPLWPDFRQQHPRNFEEIDALWDSWKPPEMPAEQQAKFGRLL